MSGNVAWRAQGNKYQCTFVSQNGEAKWHWWLKDSKERYLPGHNTFKTAWNNWGFESLKDLIINLVYLKPHHVLTWASLTCAGRGVTRGGIRRQVDLEALKWLEMARCFWDTWIKAYYGSRMPQPHSLFLIPDFQSWIRLFCRNQSPILDCWVLKTSTCRWKKLSGENHWITLYHESSFHFTYRTRATRITWSLIRSTIWSIELGILFWDPKRFWSVLWLSGYRSTPLCSYTPSFTLRLSCPLSLDTVP
jgi:hypothetical protein